MNRRAIIGAVRFPAFLLLWTAGIVLFMGRFESADAMLPMEPHCAATAAAALALPPSIAPDLSIRPMVEVREPGKAAATAEAAAGAIVFARPPAVLLVDLTPPGPVVYRQRPASPRASAESAGPPPARPGPRMHKTSSASTTQRTLRVSEARRAIIEQRFVDAYLTLRPGVADARHDVEYLGLLAIAALRSGGIDEAVLLYRHLTVLQSANERWWTGLELALRWSQGPPSGVG